MRRKHMRHLKIIKSAMSGAAAAALTQVKRDLKKEISEDELNAMGKGEEDNEEERDDNE